MTKSDITDYVSPDQLLVKFGGTDTWVYEYNPVEMRQIAEGVWQRDPLIIEETESEGEGLEEEESEDSLKQVLEGWPDNYYIIIIIIHDSLIIVTTFFP